MRARVRYAVNCRLQDILLQRIPKIEVKLYGEVDGIFFSLVPTYAPRYFTGYVKCTFKRFISFSIFINTFAKLSTVHPTVYRTKRLFFLT